MKKAQFVFVLLLQFVFVVPSAFGVEFSLKLTGGFSRFSLEAVNGSLKSWMQFEKRLTDFYPEWTYVSDADIDVHAGLDFNGELICAFSSRLSFSVGAGLLYGEAGEDKALIIQEFQGPSSRSTWYGARPTKVVAYPLTLGIRFIPLVKNRFTLYVTGGAGLIWGKYVDSFGFKVDEEERFQYTESQKGSATGNIFFAGGGVMFRLEPGLDLFVEGIIRQAKIGGFYGENWYGETGTLYSFEEHNPDFDLWQKKLRILPEKPSGEIYRSVQEAEVDFSGFSVRVGLLIRF